MLEAFIKAISDKLQANPNLYAVLIYGSQANKTAKTTSDIDIDICCLNTASPILSMQILKNHQIVFINSAREYELWKIKTLNLYHDLQITNREIYRNLGAE